MTIIDTATKDRLQWLQEQLTRIFDNGWVRLDGETVFRSARQELDDIVATATPPQAVAPVLAVMKADQVEALVDAAVARVEAARGDMLALVGEKLDDSRELAAKATANVAALIRADIEGSDVEVLDAIASTRADLLAALPKAE